jgi:pyruvate/2-oxoglutarate dehydrogenase complex dihydrolipoamide acyltransferase (E2) component
VASAGAPGRSARIRDADRKGLAALSTEWSALGQGEPGRSEPAGSAGLRVTGLGVEGVDRHWPSPEPGSAPSLGFSPPRAQPVLREDSVAPGFVLTLTLCADAEALEADAAARLLAAIRRFIEHPLEMVL